MLKALIEMLKGHSTIVLCPRSTLESATSMSAANLFVEVISVGAIKFDGERKALPEDLVLACMLTPKLKRFIAYNRLRRNQTNAEHDAPLRKGYLGESEKEAIHNDIILRLLADTNGKRLHEIRSLAEVKYQRVLDCKQKLLDDYLKRMSELDK